MAERITCAGIENNTCLDMVVFQESQQLLHGIQFELIIRTMFEVKGKADLKMIEENEKLRDSFIKLANSSHYGDHLGPREWIRMGISEKVSHEDLNFFAFGMRRADYCRQGDLSYRGKTPESDPYFSELGVYFLRKISGGNGYSEENK